MTTSSPPDLLMWSHYMFQNNPPESFNVIPNAHFEKGEIVKHLELQMKNALAIMPHVWIFLTPFVTIISPTKSAPFLCRCLKEERRWIRHAQGVFGRFAVRSPQNWISHIPDDSSRTKTKYNNFLEWTFHCRGNLFPPNSSKLDQTWRKEIHLSSH